MTELPVAGYSPEDPPVGAGSVSDVVADIAAAIKPDNPQGDVSVRVGAVTAVEAASPYRVQLDITGTAWLSRTADASLKAGDRAWAVSQGEITIVAGRLNAVDAFTPIGTVLPFAGSTAPTGWAIANGASLVRASNLALFAVIGTTYGAVDGTHFNLPNLTNRVPVGSGGTYSRGDTGGASTVTITTSTMPSHGHSLSGSVGSAGSHSHGGSAGSVGDHSHSDSFGGSRSDLLAGGGSGAATAGGGSTGSAGGHSHSISTDSQGSHSHSMSGSADNTGSGGAHENMPPYVAMPYIIRVS
jgi:microcystin-dependent protein